MAFGDLKLEGLVALPLPILCQKCNVSLFFTLSYRVGYIGDYFPFAHIPETLTVMLLAAK